MPNNSISKAAKMSERLIPRMTGSFGTSLVSLMDELGFTSEKLSETSQISVGTISRMRNSTGYRPTYKSLVALCIGMSLPPSVSKQLIEKSGVAPIAGYYADICYETALYTMWYKSIHEVNEMLKITGVPALTKTNKEQTQQNYRRENN